MKIYTLTGDDGTTSLSGGRRVPKHCDRVEAYGSVDELISWIGLLGDLNENINRKPLLLYIQDQLMRSAAIIATEKPDDNKKLVWPDEDCLLKLEHEIDRMEEKLAVLHNFIIPGGNLAVSYCHIARCVCRRAERSVLRLKQKEEIPVIITKFLNRLSDLLFVMARTNSQESGSQELAWPIR